MPPHNTPFEFYQAPLSQVPVLAAGNIAFDRMGCVIPASTAAGIMTLVLMAPTKAGIIGTVVLAVDGGDLTLTVDSDGSGYNANGDTSITFDDAQDFVTFISIYSGTTYYWRVLAYEGTNVTVEDLDVDQLSIGGTLITATASEINQLDGLVLGAMTPGTGISTGTGTVCGGNVLKTGTMFKTEIFIDLTGLNSGGTAGDIIGKTSQANCHIGQITAAKNGTIKYGQITCLETPNAGDDDIDFFGTVLEPTGVQDTAISALTNEAQLLDNGNWTGAVATPIAMTTLPGPGYLYLVNLTTAATATYDAGQFLVELWGA